MQISFHWKSCVGHSTAWNIFRSHVDHQTYGKTLIPSIQLCFYWFVQPLFSTTHPHFLGSPYGRYPECSKILQRKITPSLFAHFFWKVYKRTNILHEIHKQLCIQTCTLSNSSYGEAYIYKRLKWPKCRLKCCRIGFSIIYLPSFSPSNCLSNEYLSTIEFESADEPRISKVDCNSTTTFISYKVCCWRTSGQ